MTTSGHGEGPDRPELDEALIAQLAHEAERGFTSEQLAGRPHGRGRSLSPVAPRDRRRWPRHSWTQRGSGAKTWPNLLRR